MSSTPGDEISSGRFSRAATQPLKPVDVDCTGWERDVLPNQWSTGKLDRATQAIPPVEGAFVATGSLELEIALRIEPGIHPARAFIIATQLVAAVLAHDLGHGLTCAARLEKLADVVRQAAKDASGVALNSIHIVRAA